MSETLDLHEARRRKTMRADASRAGNQALVCPAIGAERDEVCMFAEPTYSGDLRRCTHFAEYHVSGSGTYGLCCPRHLDSYIRRFFAWDYAEQPKPRATWCSLQYSDLNPDWNESACRAWRRAYHSGEQRHALPVCDPVQDRGARERAAYRAAMQRA